MTASEERINWEEIFSLYNTVKWLYALCEETDPYLNTNLQPLNEFRAALDHLMRIVAIENLEEYSDKSAVDEAKKLRSHLRRAFFDICDLVSIHYRNKIIDCLKDYSSDEISRALPTYYPEIRPEIESISEEIASLRTSERFKAQEGNSAIDRYAETIKRIQEYHKTVLKAYPSLQEIKKENQKKERAQVFAQWIIPIAAIVIGAVIGIFGWFL